MEPERLGLDRYRSVVVMTGAGISAGSGLPVYRGSGGVLDDELAALLDVASIPGRLAELWAYLREVTEAVDGAAPNAAHHLADAQRRAHADGREFLVATMNIDRLHTRAGTVDVAEVHGAIGRARCDRCRWVCPDPGGEVPACPSCAGPLRPDVVLYGESLDGRAWWAAKSAVRECDLFLAVGTSLEVSTVSSLAYNARYAGARCIHVNLTPPEQPDPSFTATILGPAEEILPVLCS